MTTPNEKIRAGLDKLEREKSNGHFKLAGLVGAPASVSDLNKLAELASRKRDRLKVLADSIISAAEKRRVQVEARYADFGMIRDGNTVTDTVGNTRRRAAIEREMSKFARDARKISADERTQLLVELREITDKISSVKSSWADPVALLNRKTLADASRATYSANLASAGPVATENALRDSVLTGDIALAAAALDRLDAMPKESRKSVRYSKRDVAESLVSEEWRKAAQFIAMAEIANLEANVANDETEGKRISSQRKIGLGIKKQDLANLFGVDTLDSNSHNDSAENESLEQKLDRLYPGVPGSNPDKEAA